MLVGFNIVLAFAIICGVSGVGYIKWRFGEISKINLQGVLSNNGSTGGSSQPMTILLVGSDTRALSDSGDSKSFGGSSVVGGQRSDTIMLLHVDPKTQHAAILSIPRDTWVNIAGTSGRNRINSAFDTGPENLIKTIQNDFNIPIDHYAQVDFDSFRSVVNSIGGVEIPFSAPARDWGFDENTGTTHNLSGLNITQAAIGTNSCVNLTGDQALSYVRSRHYQLYENGKWVSDPLSDFGRIERQQDFIRRVIRKSVDKGSSNPLTLNSIVSSGVKNVKFDTGLSLGSIVSLANRFKSLDPTKVEMQTLPTTGTVIGGADVLLPKQPDAQQTIDRFLNGDTTATSSANIPPASISIRVLNGSGVAGQASTTSGALGNVGFVVLGTGDGSRLATTTIQYAAGEQAKADVIAKYINGPIKEVQSSTVTGVDAIVTLGTGFTGVNSTGTTTTTSTTVPPSTTTTSTTQSPFVPSPTATC